MSQDDQSSRRLRKGMITGFGANNTVSLDYNDGGLDAPLARWMFGGITSGLHVGPSQYDQAIVLRWGDRYKPSALVPMTDYPEQLATIAPGEVLLYGPGGSTLLQANASYALRITANGCAITINSTGDVILQNAVASITIGHTGGITLTPQAGQSTSVVGDLHVSGNIYSGATELTVP